MSDLEQYRQEIDLVDDEMAALFCRRIALVEKIGAYKIRSGRDVFDPVREKEKLDRLTKDLPSAFLSDGMREMFAQIMAISRKRQYQLLTEYGVSLPIDYAQTDQLHFSHARVVFQGVEGAYSAEAMETFFGADIEKTQVETWREAMELVSREKMDFAVLPIENSTAGSVSTIYDLLLEYENYIVGEQVLPIQHLLLGMPGANLSELQTVYSHPQALQQCAEYLDQHPAWRRQEMLNTAMAAERVARDGLSGQAAIASRTAAEHFGLEILDEDFSREENATRFIIISHHRMFVRDAQKISICFGLPHACGTLYSMLGHFIFNGLNLCKIESRPIPDKPFQYRFFIDFDGNLQEPAVRNALRGIAEEAEGFRLLGNY